MKRVIFSIFIALVLCSSLFAEINLPKEHRVKNFDSGCCVWCAVENLGNIHGILSLKGIAKHRHENYGNKKKWVEGSYIADQFGNLIRVNGPHWVIVNEAPGTPERVIEEFTRLKVDYNMQLHGNYDVKILNKSMDENLGCAVGLRNFPCDGCYHMVTLTHIDNDKVVFVDNNGDLPRVEKTREWFNNHWTGYTIVVRIPKELPKYYK